MRAELLSGTARLGADVADPGTVLLSFAAGEVVKTLYVPVVDDLEVEGEEAVTLSLSGLSGGSFAGGDSSLRVAGKIIDNDVVRPGVTVDGANVTEGDGPGTVAYFVLRLSADAGVPVTFRASTVALEAQAGSDFTGFQDRLFTMQSGQSSIVIPVTLIGDRIPEAPEKLGLVVSSLTGVSLPSGVTTLSASLVILDQDPVSATGMFQAGLAYAVDLVKELFG
jgi:hypothetical protein